MIRTARLLLTIVLLTALTDRVHALEHIRVSDDGSHFVQATSGQRFVAWGVNYDHDGDGRLLDEYWIDEWDTVVEDFHEIKALGANCVRIHLQVGKFLDNPDQPSAAALAQLKQLVKLAEEIGLYLDVTGLACYHKANVPDWLDSLDEPQRWAAQATFWKAVAQTCSGSPAIFCYDLMNEPILPGKEPETDWLAGEFGGKHFVQRISLNLKGRSRKDVAKAWVDQMVDAIRQHDRQHMVTVGVIPWVFAFGGGKPLFYSPEVGKQLDFVSVHFYPEKKQVDKALTALKAYEVGKPLVIEEMFPLKCGADELLDFVDRSATHADGWVSFYWGQTAAQLRGKDKPTIGDAITAAWLAKFQQKSATIASQTAQNQAALPLPVLQLPGSGTDPEAIDYAALPTLKGQHAVINAAALGPHARTPDKVDMLDLRLNLHNYLAYHDDKFWCIWSDGPKVEDWPTQEVRYSTSEDGLTWAPARSVTGTPKAPFAYIARGLWIRNGELLALAAHYRGKGAFGAQEQKQLRLVAFRYDQASDQWRPAGTLYENAINNFPPQRLPGGDWILTRRDSRFNVTVLIGGRKSLDDWQAFPVVRVGEVKKFRPDEPIFWPLPGGELNALFRDNGGSMRLFHATSRDEGRTWTTPGLTNFPNATSKLYSLQTSRGYRVLILNANPKIGRREIHLAVSRDGRTFTRLARLDVPSPPSIPEGVARITKKFSAGIASLQYPHVIEHGEKLLIALSRGKVQTEVFHVSLDAIDDLHSQQVGSPTRH